MVKCLISIGLGKSSGWLIMRLDKMVHDALSFSLDWTNGGWLHFISIGLDKMVKCFISIGLDKMVEGFLSFPLNGTNWWMLPLIFIDKMVDGLLSLSFDLIKFWMSSFRFHWTTKR